VPVASRPVHRLVRLRWAGFLAGELPHLPLRQTLALPWLADAFSELKRALVPGNFLAQVRSTTRRSVNWHLYLVYQEQVRALGWADPEGLSWLAVVTAAQFKVVRWANLLVVDGLTFSAQLHTLGYWLHP
jgi:hypothetical protein